MSLIQSALVDINFYIDFFIYVHVLTDYISKKAFTMICNSFPLIISQTKFLTLSGNDETSNLPELFLTNGFNLDQFLRVRIS